MIWLRLQPCRLIVDIQTYSLARLNTSLHYVVWSSDPGCLRIHEIKVRGAVVLTAELVTVSVLNAHGGDPVLALRFYWRK